METEILLRAIKRLRDVFRTQNIIGKDCVLTMIFCFLQRIFTREVCEKNGIDPKFCFEHVMENIKTDSAKARKLLYDPDEDCLMNHLDRLFLTRDFKFVIKSDTAYSAAMQFLNEPEIGTLFSTETHVDFIGTIYEEYMTTFYIKSFTQILF